MSTFKQTIRTALGVAAVCFSISACNEGTAIINEDSALRAASCALSPTILPNLVNIAHSIELQSQSIQVNGICTLGGIISRTDTVNNNFTIVADHCAFTDEAGDRTVNGTLVITEISDSPATRDWDFQSASLTQVTASAETGDRVTGNVRFQQFDSGDSTSQMFNIDSLSWDEIGSSVDTSVVFGETELTIQQSTANSSTTFDFNSQVDLCGFDAFGLAVTTVEPLLQLESDFFPSSGTVEARANDGSSLSISLDGEIIAINLDSNADEVSDLELSMTWTDFQGATTVAARQRTKAPARPMLPFWLWYQ